MNNNTETPDDTLAGIAIIGLAGRFPGANHIDTFWSNLRTGIESITFFTDEELLASGLPLEILKQPNYVKAKGYLEETACFDAAFFGYSPREADFMDPQQRLFLESAWHALEHAGVDPQRYPGWIGIFGGAGDNHYLHYLLSQSQDPLQTTQDTHVFFGNYRDFMVTRTSYKLNLTGPSVTVQTACSTSLVAINLACQSLLSYECDLALAGGCSVRIPSKAGYFYEDGGIPSPDGHCRPFDALAQGTISGDGVALIVLKRLEDALVAGDTIHAVIKGFATNNDGASKIGYTAPSVEGQATVISLAHNMAGGKIDDISYIEAHGTGTPLGDPVEIKALTQAFRQHTRKTNFCRIGAVKSNVGHLDAAAGVTGVIKTVLALQHEEIPPSLHFHQPNPNIDFAHSPFIVNDKLLPWPRGEKPRRAGVSSFGIGGTNAHLVLEEAPPVALPTPSRPYQLLLFSAKTALALEQITTNFQTYVPQHPRLNLADAAYTLQIGRGQFEYRRFLLCQDVISLLHPHPTKMCTHLKKSSPPAVIFMFSGQGSQYVQMGRGLYEGEPLFREVLDHGAELLAPLLGMDVRTVLYPPPEKQAWAEPQIHQTAWTQPVLFILEYALAKLLMAWGIQPKAMIGHSIGEYVAACLAGVFSLADALTLVCGRGRLMQALPPGAMLSVAWSKVELTAFLKTQAYGTLLSFATENAPQSIVLAGPVEAIVQVQIDLTQREIKTRRLKTSQAFHSAMMDPCLNAFASLLKTVTLRPPQQPFISNVTGTWIQPAQATDPNYWVIHLRQTVQFSRGVTTLLQEAPPHIFLEVGAGLTLNSLVRKHLTTSSHELVLSTLPPPQSDEPDQSVLLTTLGHLWLTGLELNWTAFYQHETRCRIPLPGYPFARQIHWVKPVPKSPVGTKPVSLPSEEEIASLVPPPKQDNLADWFYLPRWQPTLPLLPVAQSATSSWLLFMDDCGIGTQLANRLNNHVNQIIQAIPGEQFHALPNQTYTLNSQRREDYEALLNHLPIQPTQVVYLWGVTKTGSPTPSAYEYYNQLLFLVQALGKQSTLEHPVRLTILTNQMQPVQPQEELEPAKAVLLGLVKTIPLEYPHISCRTVDILVPPAESCTAFIEQLVLELTTSSKDPLVAYRQQKRWIQKYLPTPLPSGATTPRLKAQGIYLIIGGLGGVGLALAEYLAHHYQAKLALVGRTPFPPKSTWNSWLHEGLSSPLDSWAPTLAEEENHLWQISPIKGIPDYPGLAEQLVALCCSYAYHYLTTPLTQPTTVTKAHLKTLLRVQPKLEKFFEFMLRCLVDHHYAVVIDEAVTLLQTPLPPANLAATLYSEFPGFRGLLTLLNHCATHYPQALSGEIPSISVLYPEGQFEFLQACDQDTVAHSYEPIYRQLLRYLLNQLLLSHSLEGRPLKILEIGAGNGLLTWELIPALAGKNVEYYFTDLGPSFVKQAQRQAETAAITFMQFNTLDLSKNPLAQGFEQESFDIILGMNVVHATSHLEESLFHLQWLLAPNGLLGLIETIQSYVWVDMAWGLTEGWWYFQDYPLRTQSPLLSLAQWETLLQRQPFRYIKTFPDDTTEKRAKTDIGLILAQKRSRSPRLHQPEWLSKMTPLQRTRTQIAKLQQLEQHEEAAVEVYCADVADPTSMTTVLTSVKERFGLLNGVIHAALVLKDGMIQFKEPEIAKPVMVAKVTGTEILYELVKDQPLDFFVLCSSLASVIGTYAQSDYCAANAYQDAFAHQKRVQDHFPIWSINWGIWQDTGAAMRLMMSKTAAASHPQWVAHPLFDYRIVSGSRIVYAGHLSIEKDWLLKEHRLNHQALVPGTAYLELARAAFQHHTHSPTFELQAVYFLKPLVVPVGQEVEFLTLLEPATEREGFQFTILSGPLTEHAKGTILSGTQSTSQQYDIALLKRYCPQPQPIISANPSADQLTTVGPVAVGPRWSQALQTVQFGIQQGLALISLPTTYLDDLLHYHLHPALLDIATSFALGNGDFYLPLAYQKLRYYQPLPAKFYASARYLEDSTSGQETLSYEVLLLDETGQECVTIEGFTLRKVAIEHLVLETLPETDLTLNNWLAPNIHPELQEGMSSAEGAEAFTRVLTQDAPQVVVSTQELTAVLTRNETQHILRNKTEHLQQFQAVEQQIQRHQAQSLSPLKLATAITFEVSTASVQDWEQALIPIWQEVLGVQQITAADNFFELNGDSLLAIMVTTRIRTAFQIEATPDLLFKAPTIALLAPVLAHQNKGTSSNPTIFEPMTSNLVGEKEEEKELARTTQILPLTFGQQRMWFLSGQVPQDDVYIIPSVYKIQGALNVSAFKASLAALIRRHDALRTTFTLEQGQVKQVIWTTQPLVLTEPNLLNHPIAEQESEVNRLLTHFLQQPFHLLKELPWRLLLIQVAPEEYIFGMIFHNIIVDGWSLGVLNRDLATLYNAFCHHHASPLAALTMNYADFTRWQGEHFQGETLAATVSYWEQGLTSLPTTVLPYDHSPTTTPNGYRGKVSSLRIPANLVSQLKTFNAQHQATMFITLGATFELLLYSYQPQEIITVWSPFANRTQQALEPVAGLFVNALPVSLDCRGNPSFLQLVQRFQTSVLELTQHSHFPFAALLEKHDFSRQPLTRTEFVFHNYSLSPVQLNHLTVTPLGMAIGSTAYDLEVHLWQVDRGGFSDSIEATGSIAGELFYNTAFFEPETINGLMQRFYQLLERVLSQPERAIKEILTSLPRIN